MLEPLSHTVFLPTPVLSRMHHVAELWHYFAQSRHYFALFGAIFAHFTQIRCEGAFFSCSAEIVPK